MAIQYTMTIRQSNLMKHAIILQMKFWNTIVKGQWSFGQWVMFFNQMLSQSLRLRACFFTDHYYGGSTTSTFMLAKVSPCVTLLLPSLWFHQVLRDAQRCPSHWPARHNSISAHVENAMWKILLILILIFHNIFYWTKVTLGSGLWIPASTHWDLFLRLPIGKFSLMCQ